MLNVNFLELYLSVTFDLYENDVNILSYLKSNVHKFNFLFRDTKHKVKFNLFEKDFIAENSHILNDDTFFSNSIIPRYYNYIISNPPYFKLQKNHMHSLLMQKVVHGQPNIYFFFMALSALLLKDKGELVFITPRSYCSGLYFKKFRKWFLDIVKPIYIHIFESRRETFNNDVLQEIIILKAKKLKCAPKTVKISQSVNSEFDKSKVIVTKYQSIIDPADKETIIKIPSNKKDIDILNLIESWPRKFSELGFRISTGPVVFFRAKKFISNDDKVDGLTKVPLLWMHHIDSFQIKYPNFNLKKPQSIIVNSESKKLLLVNKNYVLVKRFSSKEQNRRVYAATYLKENIPTNYIGIENHLNYIWKPCGELSIDEAYGIMGILNSTLIDKYFRIINGNTQVNATEINNMPFPDHETIIEIGYNLKNIPTFDNINFDQFIFDAINPHLKMEGILN